MEALVLVAALIVVSIITVAIALRRGGTGDSAEPGVVRRAFHFLGGPFPLSIAIHLAALLFLVVTVHESRGRNLIMVNFEAGDGGGNQLENLEVPDVPMPDVAPQFETPTANSLDEPTLRSLEGFVRSPRGIGIGRGSGTGSGQGPGIGSGFSGFIGNLRRTGLDVVLVIDGTDSMRLVMEDVKARMTEMVRAIHRLVPTARIGIVVYGGEGEPIDVQPLTLSSAKLERFLTGIQTKGGGEWEENLAGAIQTAVEQMDWKPFAHKVIVVVGDAPPKADRFSWTLDLARKLHRENGVLNTIDVTAQEHERFEREFAIRVHRAEPGKVSPLPAFYQQTRAAYFELAHAGGGSMKNLEGTDQINQQVLMLAFGNNWAEQVAQFAPVREPTSP
jgi:von Willebrand factor type A domain